MEDYQTPNDLIYVIKRDGTVNNPYVDIEEVLTVKNKKVMLNEVPDSFTRVVVKDQDGNQLVETRSPFPQGNQFYVDYKNGFVYFHESNEGKDFVFEYKGIGKLAISYKRLYFENQDEQDTIQTIGDLTNQMQEKLNDFTSIEDDLQRIKDGYNTLDPNNYATLDTLENSIAGFEGRNLLKNSNIFYDFKSYSNSQITYQENFEVSEWNATDATRVMISGGSGTIKAYKNLLTSQYTEEDEFYTLSVYVKNISSNPVYIFSNSNIEENSKECIEPNESKRVSVLFKRFSNSSTTLQIQIRTEEESHDVDVVLWRAKAEKGTRATPWTPAWEDILERLDNLESDMSAVKSAIINLGGSL